MIDRDQLTEALALHEKALPALALVVDASVFDHYSAIALKLEAAARLLLDFPTGQQVEAAAPWVSRSHHGHSSFVPCVVCIETARAALEAVRDTMIGDNQ